MPLLISPELIAASQQAEAGWGIYALTTYSEKPHKESVAHYFNFEGISGPGNTDKNKGRRLLLVVYESAIKAGVEDVCKFVLELTSALTGMSREELKDQLVDFNNCVGKQALLLVKDETYEGRILKKGVSALPPDVEPPF